MNSFFERKTVPTAYTADEFGANLSPGSRASDAITAHER